MLGCYDFCGYYEMTFQWLEDQGGPELVRDYWIEGISIDSQRHARALILPEGFAGMAKYWGHTLLEESPDLGYSMQATPEMMRIDMQDCPSKGFLGRNGLQQYADYCDHCIGWIGPLMKDAGYVVDHEHNHCGQCWWEFRRADNPAGPSKAGEVYEKDARLLSAWTLPGVKIDRFRRATDVNDKAAAPESPPETEVKG